MTHSPHPHPDGVSRPPAGTWPIYRTQLLLLATLSTLLFIGFPGTREWRRVAEESHMQTIIRAWDGLSWYTWLAAAPFMLILVRRFPLERGRVLANLGRLATGSVGIYLVVTHVRYGLRMLAEIFRGSRWESVMDFDTYAYNTFAILPLDLLTYCGFFAVSFAVDNYYKRRRDTEQAIKLQIKTAELQSDLARAELAALRGQLHPHFLFNSFNALATLVRQRRNDEAVEIIAQLSSLLRLAIDRTGLQEIALHHEIDFIRRYLDIEQVRFQDKLRIEFDMEPAVLTALVPNIVLQPLVENAIKHGISLRTSPGVVRLAAARKDNRLIIEIANDGPEESSAAPEGPVARRPGIGLANARAQLGKLYGTDYGLVLTKQPAGPTVVTLNLPWRQAAS